MSLTRRPRLVLEVTVALAFLSAPAAAEVLVYSTDPGDPWNRIGGLLLTEPEGRERPRPLLGWTGDDAPDFFFEVDPAPPRAGPRLQQLVEALDRESREPHLKGRTIEGRLLFQQDLWRIFDETFRREDAASPELREPVGRLLAVLAPTQTELASLRSNWLEVATPLAPLDAGMMEGGVVWRELRALFRRVDSTSLHATAAGYRRVFRAFARLPAGVELGSTDSTLPNGSRVALVETLIALTSTGELRPVPIVVGLEIRQTPVAGNPDEAVRLVLHASRLALAQGERANGGLRPIPDEALVRSTLTCYPFKGSLEPLREACMRCHGPTGRMLQTGSVRGPDHVSGLELLDPLNTREQNAILKRKATSAEYRALLSYFRKRE